MNDKNIYLYSLVRFGNEIDKDFVLDEPTFNRLIKIKWAVKKFHRYCERYCNEADFNPELIDKQEKKIREMVKDLPVGLKLEIEEIQRDPRGWEVKFNSYWFNLFIHRW